MHLPKLTESMAQVRDFGSGRLAEAEKTRQGGGIDTGLTPADRLLVGNLLHDFDVAQSTLGNGDGRTELVAHYAYKFVTLFFQAFLPGDVAHDYYVALG